jgi:hypothetical protein
VERVDDVVGVHHVCVVGLFEGRVL